MMTATYHFSWDKSWRRGRSSQTPAEYHLHQMESNGPQTASQWRCCTPAWDSFTLTDIYTHTNTQPLIQATQTYSRWCMFIWITNLKLTTRSVMVYAAGGVVSPTGWWVTAPTLRTPASLNTQRDRASANSMFPVCSCLSKTTTSSASTTGDRYGIFMKINI